MKFYLRNKKTGYYLYGYKGNKPLWRFPMGGDLIHHVAATYSKEDALRLQKRLECQSQVVELVEKKE
jgi:hypothetical protein